MGCLAMKCANEACFRNEPCLDFPSGPLVRLRAPSPGAWGSVPAGTQSLQDAAEMGTEEPLLRAERETGRPPLPASSVAGPQLRRAALSTALPCSPLPQEASQV